MIDQAGVQFDETGLVPGVVQDSQTGRVLMLGYLSAEALERTVSTKQVHFWSRSRGELWRKGATSGNTLELVDIAADCDGDALLISARPAGPTCHTGAVSCFDDGDEAQGFAALEALWDTIADRRERRPGGSYTVELLQGGVDATGRKVLEEAGETLLAAKDDAAGVGGPGRLAEEAADLVYHLLVLLAERGVEPKEMLDVLRARSVGVA